jgi:hypothetical protein
VPKRSNAPASKNKQPQKKVSGENRFLIAAQVFGHLKMSSERLSGKKRCWRRQYLSVCVMGARWFIFIPKIPIWVYFGGPWYGKCWYILWPFGIFKSFRGYLWPLGTVCGYLVYFSCFGTFGPRKIWQPWSVLALGAWRIMLTLLLHQYRDTFLVFGYYISLTRMLSFIL